MDGGSTDTGVVVKITWTPNVEILPLRQGLLPNIFHKRRVSALSTHQIDPLLDFRLSVLFILTVRVWSSSFLYLCTWTAELWPADHNGLIRIPLRSGFAHPTVKPSVAAHISKILTDDLQCFKWIMGQNANVVLLTGTCVFIVCCVIWENPPVVPDKLVVNRIGWLHLQPQKLLCNQGNTCDRVPCVERPALVSLLRRSRQDPMAPPYLMKTHGRCYCCPGLIVSSAVATWQ